MLILLGMFHAMEGVVALAKDDVFLVRTGDLVVGADYAMWGWTHLAAGVTLILAGVGVLAAQVWARIVGTALAMVSAILSVSFLAAYPLGSITMVGLAVVVILALTVHGSEIRPQ